MSESYYDKMADEEAHWKNQEAEWLEKFKKTPLYAELQEKYEATSLKSGLDHTAQMRTIYYRHGPTALKELQKRAIKFQTDATFFLRQIQEKKWYDKSIGWMIGDVQLEGIYSIFQITIGEGPIFTCPHIDRVRPEEIDFLRHLLQDEDYIRSGEFPQFDSHIPDVEEHAEWHKVRNPTDEFPEDYPVFFRKYDQWFNQVHRLHLPLLRYQKYLQYRDVWVEYLHKKNPPKPDPEEGKPYYLETDELNEVCKEWFRKYEPAKMQVWYAAHEKYMWRESVYDSSQFFDAMDALYKNETQPYPDGSLPWNKALLTEGRRIWFRDITDALEPAYQAYLSALKAGEPVLGEKETMFKNWIGNEGINENEKKMIITAQNILGETETLNY